MDLSTLNSHLRQFKIEFVCQKCETNRQKPAAISSDSIRAPLREKTRKKKISKKTRQPKHPSTPTKPTRFVDPYNAWESGQKAVANTTVPRGRLIYSQPRNELILSPIRGNNPPNPNLNLNTRLSPFEARRTPIKNLFDDIITTPQKIAEVHLPSNHKNPNVLNMKFKPQIFSTNDVKQRTGDLDSIRDLSLDSNDKKNFVNLMAFSNVPSCFQSPFLTVRPIGEDASPSKSVGFERLGDHLEFLENPFLEDLE